MLLRYPCFWALSRQSCTHIYFCSISISASVLTKNYESTVGPLIPTQLHKVHSSFLFLDSEKPGSLYLPCIHLRVNFRREQPTPWLLSLPHSASTLHGGLYNTLLIPLSSGVHTGPCGDLHYLSLPLIPHTCLPCSAPSNGFWAKLLKNNCTFIGSNNRTKQLLFEIFFRCSSLLLDIFYVLRISTFLSIYSHVVCLIISNYG